MRELNRAVKARLGTKEIRNNAQTQQVASIVGRVAGNRT